MSKNVKPEPPKMTAPAPAKPPAAKPKPATAPNRPMGMRMAEQATKNLKLAPCKFCNRKFAENRLEEHQQICAHLQKKPRKVYDARQHRLRGTEIEKYVKMSGTKSQKPKHPPNNWKKKHDEFMKIMASAEAAEKFLASGGKAADLPPPPASDYSDYVQCPYCGRRFNQAAAQRHIDACQGMVHNKPGGALLPLIPVPGGKGKK